jgi:hypothetical protein
MTIGRIFRQANKWLNRHHPGEVLCMGFIAGSFAMAAFAVTYHRLAAVEAVPFRVIDKRTGKEFDFSQAERTWSSLAMLQKAGETDGCKYYAFVIDQRGELMLHNHCGNDIAVGMWWKRFELRRAAASGGFGLKF